MFLWNTKWAKQGKYKLGTLNPTATDIPAFRNLERQTSSWGIGCSTPGLHHWSQEEELHQWHKQLWVPESPAVWELLSWMHLACHGDRGTKIVTDWGPLCSKAGTSFTQRAKLTLTLVGTCTVCSTFQTIWETRTFHHPSLSTSGEVQICNAQNTAQYQTSLECKQ